MNNFLLNPCFRCGKERIVIKKWKETIITSSGTSQVVEYTDTACPDRECQKILDQQLLQQKEKRDQIRNKKDATAQEKKARRHPTQ